MKINRTGIFRHCLSGRKQPGEYHSSLKMVVIIITGETGRVGERPAGLAGGNGAENSAQKAAPAQISPGTGKQAGPEQGETRVLPHVDAPQSQAIGYRQIIHTRDRRERKAHIEAPELCDDHVVIASARIGKNGQRAPDFAIQIGKRSAHLRSRHLRLHAV